MSESSSAKKGKGRLSDPTSSSSNPSASFSALWNYIEPALDHIVRSPSNTTDKAPAIDVAYYLNIHTATYTFFTNSSTGRMGFDPGSPVDSPGSSLSPISPAASMMGGPGTRDQKNERPHGTDLYEKLDKYYAEACQEILAGHPIDDSNLIDYLLPCFQRYRAGAQSIHRLLNYVNRQFVRRAVEEDRGWLRLADILFLQTQTQASSDAQKTLPTPISPTTSTTTSFGKSKSNKKKKKGGSKPGTPKPGASSSADAALNENNLLDTGGGGGEDADNWNSNGNPRELIATRLQKRRMEELQKWGYNQGADPPERLSRAESAAEAASSLDRIVPLYALALRRFRTEVITSLLAIPKGKKGAKTIKAKRGGATLGIVPGGVVGATGGDGPAGEGSAGPKSRLARAVRYLVEEDQRDEEVRRTVAGEVNDMMELVGVPGDHVLRKKLTKFSASSKVQTLSSAPS